MVSIFHRLWRSSNNTELTTTIIIIIITNQSLPLQCVEIALYRLLTFPFRALFLVQFCDQSKCHEALRHLRKRIVIQTVQFISNSNNNSIPMDTITTTTIIINNIPISAGIVTILLVTVGIMFNNPLEFFLSYFMIKGTKWRLHSQHSYDAIILPY